MKFNNKKISNLFLVSVGICILDQISKFVIQKVMYEGQSIKVLGNLFKLSFYYNQNGAFGIPVQKILPFLHPTFFYCLFMIIAILLLLTMFKKSYEQGFLNGLALSLILGGALGNFIDRVIFGRVVDFLDADFINIHIAPFEFLFLHFPGYYMDRWPTFNIADSSITCGITLLIIVSFKVSKTYGKKDDQH
ncbi:MAG: signal peptidase II [bacterium]